MFYDDQKLPRSKLRRTVQALEKHSEDGIHDLHKNHRMSDKELVLDPVDKDIRWSTYFNHHKGLWSTY